MSQRDQYLAAGSAHDADYAAHFAPWNDRYSFDPPPAVCAWCEWRTEDDAHIGLYWGEHVCDQCMVDNANACGDWDQDAIECAKRLGVTHPEKTTA